VPPSPARILVVDDDNLIRRMLKLQLEAAGHRIDLAVNGREAIASLEQNRPDLMILDLFMPEMDGFETLHRLNRARATGPIRVLAISGGGSLNHCDYLRMASRLGADAVLQKPFNAAQMIAAVDALLPQDEVSPEDREPSPPTGPGSKAS
jgi:CheY-like chemotaxis protein